MVVEIDGKTKVLQIMWRVSILCTENDISIWTRY